MSELADELASIDARLRAVPTQEECSRAVNDLLAFMNKNAPVILAALRPVPDEAVAEKAVHAVAEIEMEREGFPLARTQDEIYEDADETVQAVLTALSPSIEQVRGDEGWRTMESAPRDETRVLLWVEHPLAKFNSHKPKEYDGRVTGYWTDFNNGGWVWHGMVGTPVAWQPLPPPPAIRTGDSDRG